MTKRQGLLLVVAVALCIVLAPVSTMAQAPDYLNSSNLTGLPEWGTFIRSDIDNINLQNGAVSIRIPLLSRKMRHFEYAQGYRWDSKLWVTDRYSAWGPPPLTIYNWRVDEFAAGWHATENSTAILEWVEQSVYCPPEQNDGSGWLPVGDDDDLPGGGGDVTIRHQSGSLRIISNFTVTDGDGTKLQFPNRRMFVAEGSDPYNSCMQRYAPSKIDVITAYSDDAQYKLEFSGDLESPHVRLTAKDGSWREGMFCSTIFCGLGPWHDTNGNLSASLDSEGWTVDNMGRRISRLLQYRPQQGGAYDDLQYYDSGGNLQNIRVEYTGIDAATDFPTTRLDGVQFRQGAQGMAVVSKITLNPNDPADEQLTYEFSYAPSPSYGEVTQIKLPTGGTIDYTYTTIAQRDHMPSLLAHVCDTLGNCLPMPLASALDARVLHTKTITVNGQQQRWTYEYTDSQTTVYDPGGNKQVYTFEDFYDNNPKRLEKVAEYYQGTSTILKKVETEWTGDSGPVSAGQPEPDGSGEYSGNVSFGLRNANVASVTTTLDSAITSRVLTTYGDCTTYSVLYVPYTDCRNNPTRVAEYDYGSAAATRTRETTYLHSSSDVPDAALYDAAHIWDRARSVRVCEGDCPTEENDFQGVKSETRYSYSSAINGNAMVGVPGHVSASGPRANLVTEERWISNVLPWVTTTHSYNDVGNYVQTSDAEGHVTTFSYDDNFSDGQDRNSQAYLTQVIYPPTNGVSHIERKQYYWNSGLVAAMCGQNYAGTCQWTAEPTQPDQTTLTYDGLNRPVSVATAGGARRSFTYNLKPDGLLTIKGTTKVKDGMPDYVEKAVLDGMGRVHKTITSDPEGDVYTRTDYDGFGRKVSVWNPTRCDPDKVGSCSGETTFGFTSIVYDGLGRTTKNVPPDGTLYNGNCSNCVITQYSGNVVTTTDEAGKQRTTHSDALGRLVEVDEPAPVTTETGAATLSDPPQATTTDGRPVPSITGISTAHAPLQSPVTIIGINYPAGSLQYGPAGTLVTIRGANFGSFGTVTFHGVPASQMSWSSSIISVYVPDGAATGDIVVTVDGQSSGGVPFVVLQNLVSTSCPVPPPVPTTPSSVSATAAPNAPVILLEWNASGGADLKGFRIERCKGHACGDFAVLSSWAGPDTSSYTDSGLEARTEYSYRVCAFNSVGCSAPSAPASAVTFSPAPLDNSHRMVTTYQYDALDNLVGVQQQGSAITSADYRVRAFKYDGLSRLTQASNPESGIINYKYDEDGNLTQRTDERGSASGVVSYCYDELHRIKGKRYADTIDCNSSSTWTVRYIYDLANGLTNTYAVGRRTGMVDSSGTVAWAYDKGGRITLERRNIGTHSRDTGYRFNDDSSVDAITYPSGRVVQYSYSNARRPLRVEGGGVFAQLATYTPSGALATMQLGDAINITNTYNSRQQPSWLSATAGVNTILSFTYDFHGGSGNNGNVHQIINGLDDNRTQNFAYDELNRLTRAWTDGPIWGGVYTIDGWGNLINKDCYPGRGVQGSTDCDFGSTPSDNRNRLLAGSYDPAGNLLNDTSHSYAYDAENRVTRADANLAFSYDGDGKRLGKCFVDPQTGLCTSGTLYWTGTGSDALAETDTANNLQSEYIFFNGKRIARVDVNGSVYYYLGDHLGTSRIITTADGTVCYDADYYPYGGEQHVYKDSCPQNYKFTGKERDTETGLDYFGARYYGSNMGRFMSPDPVTITPERLLDPQQLNAYAYVRNSPTQYTDPNGKWLQGDHYNIIDAAFMSSLTPYQLQILKDASDRIDADFQAPKFSYMHGMADGTTGQSAIDAQREMLNFVDMQLNDAVESQLELEECASCVGGLSASALNSFGEGLHAYVDQYSPQHQFSPWYGTTGQKIAHGSAEFYVSLGTLVTESYQKRQAVEAAKELWRQFQNRLEQERRRREQEAKRKAEQKKKEKKKEKKQEDAA